MSRAVPTLESEVAEARLGWAPPTLRVASRPVPTVTMVTMLPSGTEVTQGATSDGQR